MRIIADDGAVTLSITPAASPVQSPRPSVDTHSPSEVIYSCHQDASPPANLTDRLLC